MQNVEVERVMEAVRARAAELEGAERDAGAAAAARPEAPPLSWKVLGNWDPFTLPEVQSHRRLVGRLVTAAKKGVLLAVRPLQHELFRRQREFNQGLLEELTQLRSRVAELERERSRTGQRGK